MPPAASTINQSVRQSALPAGGDGEDGGAEPAPGAPASKPRAAATPAPVLGAGSSALEVAGTSEIDTDVGARPASRTASRPGTALDVAGISETSVTEGAPSPPPSPDTTPTAADAVPAPAITSASSSDSRATNRATGYHQRDPPRGLPTRDHCPALI